eukprot:jgi/Ulvmu1/11220/UM072_0057.1
MTVHDYTQHHVPSAFFFEAPAALMLGVKRALPTVFPLGPAVGRLPQAGLDGVVVTIAMATLAAGLAGTQLASPSDVYHETTGTLGPVVFLQRYTNGNDAVPKVARLTAAHVDHLARAAAEHPSSHSAGEQTGDAGGSVAAVVAAARAEGLAQGGASVARVLRLEVLRTSMEQGAVTEAVADAWLAHSAAARLPLHVRASVPPAWEDECAARDGAQRVQRIIEAFSTAALPMLRAAYELLQANGCAEGAEPADGELLVIPFGQVADPGRDDADSTATNGSTTCKPHKASALLRNACIDIYDPRVLGLLCHATAAHDGARAADSAPVSSGPHALRSCTARPSAAGRELHSEQTPWRGLYRLQLRDSTLAAAHAAHAEEGSCSTASALSGSTGMADDPAMHAEDAAIAAVAAAVRGGPAAGAAAALELLRSTPRISEADVHGTMLDLEEEGVQFTFAGPSEALVDAEPDDAQREVSGESSDTAAGTARAAQSAAQQTWFYDLIQEQACQEFADGEDGGGSGAEQEEDAAEDALRMLGPEDERSEGGAAVGQVDLARIADMSEITVAQAEAADAAWLSNRWNQQKARLKQEATFQRYLENYASTLSALDRPTPRQQLILQAPAAVASAEAAMPAAKPKGGPRKKGKKLKSGQGTVGGKRVKEDAARATEAKARRAGRELVRSWVRAARVDHACQGSEAAATNAALQLLHKERGLHELGAAGRDAIAELEFYLALLRCQARIAHLTSSHTSDAAAPASHTSAAAAAAEGLLMADEGAPRAVDVYVTVRYMEHACVPALPDTFAVCEDAGLAPAVVARTPAAMVDALRAAGLPALAQRLHSALAAGEPVRRLGEALEAAAAVRRAPAAAEGVGVGVGVGAGPAAEWQLRHAGAHLTRTIDAQPDSRVNFVPDLWQVKMLDAVDARQSLLVVAPTSSGKTFVSYYTMRAVLEANVRLLKAGKSLQRVVFVMPTKALIIQTQGDLHARYKSYVQGSAATVFASWSRDFRDPGHMCAQILITVPELLESLLLSPLPEHRKWVDSLQRGPCPCESALPRPGAVSCGGAAALPRVVCLPHRRCRGRARCCGQL